MKDLLAKLTLLENVSVKETFGKNFKRSDVSHEPSKPDLKLPKDYGKIIKPKGYKTVAKADLGKNELNLPPGYGDIIKPELDELKAGDKYGDDATAIGRGDTGEVWPLGEAEKVACPLLKGLSPEEIEYVRDYIKHGQFWGNMMDHNVKIYDKIFDNAYKMRDYLQDEGLSSGDRGSDHHLDNIDFGVEADLRHFLEPKKKARAIKEGAKYTPATPYGVKYKVFAGREQRLTTKEAWFKSAEAMERGIKKIEDLGNFYEIVGHHYPEKKTEEECMDEDSSYMDANGIETLNIGGKNFPRNRVPIEYYASFKKAHPGTAVRFRGPRLGTAHTRKENATHFNVVGVMYEDDMKESTYDSGGADEFSGSGSAQINEKSKSKKQAKFMAACAHGAGYSSCPPTSVAKEFNRADKKAGTLKNESENDDLAGDNFIDDETYNRLKKHIATKHPGYSVHGLGPNEKGGVNWQAFHKDDKHFTKPIHGVFDEGIGQTLKKVGKSIKRGAQLWDKDLTGSPRDVVTRNKSYSDKELLSLRGKEGEKPVKHSPRHLQNRVIDKEIKKRGLGETECPTCKDTGTINYKGVSVPCSNPSCKTKTSVKEVAPKGWEGTVKKMKKHKEIDNPWALANYMKDKGYKSHQKESLDEDETGWFEVHMQKNGKGPFKDTGMRESNKTYAEKHYAERAHFTGNKYKLVPVKESKENNMKNLKESILTEDPGLERVLRHFGKEVRDFQEHGSLDDHLYNALYDYWFDDMPYGVKKARDGDPYEWIEEKLYDELGGIGAKTSDEHSFSGVGAFGEGAAGDAPVYGSGNDISPLTTNNLEEGHMSEVDILMQDLARGDHDIYSVLNHPKNPVEEAASKILQTMYDDISIDMGYHPDDDFEEIIDIIGDRLADEYGDSDVDITDADLEEGEASAGYDWHQQMATQAAKPAASSNPALSAKIAAAKNAARAATAAAPTGGTMAAPVLKRPGQPAVGETMDEAMDETFLIEGLEGVITEILEEHGLDHGLDFFFDNGLVAIGKSTARVIINALKEDPRIKAEPSFGRIDGEEVQIAFDKQPRAPVKDLNIADIEPAEFNPEEPNRLGESDINEEVSLSLTATGEEDALNVIRKLSGLATVNSPAPEVSAIAAEPEEIEGAEIGPEEEMEEAEGEYVNAPDPTVHTSTTDMINRGNDLNKPKRQDFTIRNLGNNPMAETRKLFKQYEALKDTVKK